MDVQEEKFILDYFSTYYFYEKDEFRTMREDAEKILQHIEEYSRYQEGEFTFTISKFGNVSKGHTQKNIEIMISNEGDEVWIQGKKRYLDLKFKMEVKQLEDHMRIATRIIDEGHSNSCLMYIDNTQKEAFLAKLNTIKEQ